MNSAEYSNTIKYDVHISSNIKYLRQSDGLTQSDLARILSYRSASAIEKWESGVSNPPFKTLLKLSEFFDVSLDDLVYTDISSYSPITGAAKSAADLEEAILINFAHASREAQEIILGILKIDISLID